MLIYPRAFSLSSIQMAFKPISRFISLPMASLTAAQGVINNTTATYMILFTSPIAQEIPTVFPSNQRTRDNSIPNMVCSELLSNMNPYTVIPALLFSK